MTRIETANQPDSANPAVTLLFAVESQWRRVADLERYASVGSRRS
jgi:hypothetical protein